MSFFNIRVYGLLINEKNQILISDEQSGERTFSKFPGGGLELGEGLIDALKREFIEECNADIEVVSHFYTTDFFQKALFYENKQLLSIYYLTRLLYPIKFKISKKPFDFQEEKNGNQSFRWIKIKSINEDDITFPIDKFVAGKLKNHFS